MSEMIWRDCFTGTRYKCGEAWLGSVRQELTRDLAKRMSNCKTHEEAANKVGRFWKISYYERLFPLRFGCQVEEGMLQVLPLLEVSEEPVTLDDYAKRALRRRLLDGAHLPPIFPDERKQEEGWLLADRLLVEAGLLNVLLAHNPEVSDEKRHAARLAALTYPFRDELAKKFPLLANPLVESISFVLAGEEGKLAKLPDLDKSLLKTVQAVRNQVLSEQYKVRLVVVAVQRIKQYVFDTPGLNEIRGGSTLLEQITKTLRQEVEQEIGPEVVLRAAGSTLVFLAPATKEHDGWPERLRRTFWKETGATFPAAASLDVSANSLLKQYGKKMKQLYHALDIDRAQANQPFFVTLPFETRCGLCQTRAAEGWDATPGLPDIPENRRPLCAICKTKREAGKSDRRGQVQTMLETLGYRNQLATLGVKGANRYEWMADDLSSLIPKNVRRTLLGVVYGDGNNFGRVSLGLNDLALGLQWTARVEQTTIAAAALSLGQATQKGATLRGWKVGDEPVLDKVPFQVLALGGDDISLFAWAPVAMHFSAQFTYLTDLEFKDARKEELSSDALTFSLGVLVTDEKTPVVKSVDFAEHTLLGRAKKVAKSRKLSHGNIAMLYAPTAESVPANFELYRQQMYQLGAGPTLSLYMTLRPYSAEMLHRLLKVATDVVEKGHLGRLQRLVEAFYGARQSAMTGLLHYAYQRSRSSSQGWLEELEQALKPPGTEAEDDAPRLVKYGARTILVKGRPTMVWFSPLWDLIELAKLMS